MTTPRTIRLTGFPKAEFQSKSSYCKKNVGNATKSLSVTGEPENLPSSPETSIMNSHIKTLIAAVITAVSLTSLAQAQTVYQFSTTLSSSTWLTPGNWTVG